MTQAAQYVEQVHSNPLVAGIPRPWTADRWVVELGNNPLSPKDYEVALKDPETTVKMLDLVFVPNAQLAKIAAALHTLLWDSYLGRDPRYVAANGRPRTPTEGPVPIRIEIRPRGALIQGITGMGKTTLIKRLLAQLELKQVIDHGDALEGRLESKQLTYVEVSMQQGASTGAFVLALASAIDEALGTTYTRLIKGRGVQDDFHQICNVLIRHSCGAIIIDENQEGNKLGGRGAGSRYAYASEVPTAAKQRRKSLQASFATNFVTLMNAGISVWLVGNPLAFENVLASSQFTSRLEGCSFYLHPAMSAKATSWVEDDIAGIWRATCFPNGDEPYPGIEDKLYSKTGGIRSLLVAVRKCAILNALRARADRVRRIDIDVALQLDLGDIGRVANAFAKNNINVLADSTDIPHEVYEALWDKAANPPGPKGSGKADGAAPPADAVGPDGAPGSAKQPSADPESATTNKTAEPCPEPVKRARRSPTPTALEADDMRSPAARRQFERQQEGCRS